MIDAEAKDKLDALDRRAWRAARCASAATARRRPSGTYRRAAPSSSSTARATSTEEVFGPILHVVRWRADELDALLDDIAANGYGLTLGIHSRIDDDRRAHRRAARRTAMSTSTAT